MVIVYTVELDFNDESGEGVATVRQHQLRKQIPVDVPLQGAMVNACAIGRVILDHAADQRLIREHSKAI